MSRFLMFYLLIYGGINVYAGVRLSILARRWTPWGQVGLAVLIAFMVAGPIVSRMLERTSFVWVAQAIGIVTCTWMALALWFFFLGVAIDIWNVGVWLAGRAWPGVMGFRVGWIQSLIAIGVVVALATIWGVIEAQYIHVREVTIETTRLPAGSKPLRVLQVSDLHLGLIERDGRVRQVLGIIDRLKPDMIVATGDIVDGTAHHMEKLVGMWADCRPPFGKHAVFGNHEVYAGRDRSTALLSEAGFTILRGDKVTTGGIVLAGIDDDGSFRRTPRLQASENALLEPAGAQRPFTILMKHRPWIEEGSLGRFDLQLSGHTHAGQVFPFGLIVRTQYPFLHGLFALDKGSMLYVSRGTGTWGPRLRLAAPPEVCLFTIVNRGS
ncbi:metallophosphoesterase [bacterium]|nr:metallophosphoesterase [bacterium]